MAGLDRQTINVAPRIGLALVVCGLSILILIVRLWYLQIVRGEHFRQLSENNRIRTVFIAPPRGLIYDRDGVPLVSNRPSFNIELVSEDCPDIPGTLDTLERVLELEPGSLRTRSAYERRRRPFEPRLLLRDVSRDVVAKVAARRYELPGVITQVVPARQYLNGDMAAHVLGYIREITKQQLEQERYVRYRQGDVIGQYGIESRLEDTLQGTRGLQRVEVNARGTRIGEFSFEPEREGHNVYLTLDVDVQRAADEALKDKAGAVVALRPQTGEILAMASSPRFDPNLFGTEVPAAVWQDLVSGREKKLTNRAMQGAYPPGSVFKVFMGIAALAEGVVSPQERIFCPGFLPFGGRNFGCHKKEGHGSVNFEEALIQSCDVYFYTVGQRLGIDRIHSYATHFGLGVLSGLELVTENAGLIPSTAWKARAFRDAANQKWYPGETLSVAIGQGAVTVTPLQLARGLAALVNGGKLLQPYVVSRVFSNDGRPLSVSSPIESAKTEVDPKVSDLVRKAMVGVVNDARGTGKRAKLEANPEIVVAGKTGTAQTVGAAYFKKDSHFDDHAWFFAFAPAENPEIVVAVLVENGGHGGVAAAPVSKLVMDAFFTKQRQRALERDTQQVNKEIPA